MDATILKGTVSSFHARGSEVVRQPDRQTTSWDLFKEACPAKARAFHHELQLGFDALVAGSAEVALEAAASILRNSPIDQGALILSADCFSSYGQGLQAYELLCRAADVSNNDLCYVLLKAQQLLTLGRTVEAKVLLDKGVAELTNASSEDHDLLLRLYRKRLVLCACADQQWEAAWTQLQEVRNLESSWFGLAAEILLKMDQDQEAVRWASDYHQACASPDSALLLADCYFRCGDHRQYCDFLIESSTSYPDDSQLSALAAQAIFDHSASPQTIQQGWHHLNHALKHHPTSAELLFFRSRQLLLDGSFTEGWRDYQSRLTLAPHSLSGPLEPFWTGEELPVGPVVVLSEQGIGDVLFFARFLNDLLNEASQVFLVAEPRLISILRRTYPAITVVDNLDIAKLLAGESAQYIAIGSLPKRYGTNTKEIHDSQRHGRLVLDPSAVDLWNQNLSKYESKTIRLGLSLTAGTSRQSYQNTKRSVPQLLLDSALASHEFIQVFDLQHRGSLLSSPNHQIVKHESLTSHIDQLCAFISCLDLLITSDQTNAFLGGMLSIPTLAIVPPNPHFMFCRQGRTTLWFDSIRIIRSNGWADWQSCEQELMAEVSSLIHQCTPALPRDQPSL